MDFCVFLPPQFSVEPLCDEQQWSRRSQLTAAQLPKPASSLKNVLQVGLCLTCTGK